MRTRANPYRCAAGLALAGLFALAPGLAHAEDPPTRVWVFFTDSGRDAEQLASDLRTREAELEPRALARRAKVRTDRLVDQRDLLPAADYVADVERTGATLRVQSRWLNAVSVQADPATQRAIEALPFVRGIYPVGRSSGDPQITPPPAAADPADYGSAWDQLDLMGVPQLHDCGLTGAGVLVAVQDTGFVLDHQALVETEVLATYDFLDGDTNVGIEMGDPPDQHLHGSWVLPFITGWEPGVYRGAAPGASVLLSKTEDTAVEEAFEEDRYVEGLEWSEGMGADIFTTSLAYFDWYTYMDFDGASAVTTIAVEVAVGNGVIVFTAMGNKGPAPGSLGAPADAAGAISLGAVNAAGELADFSSRGPTADDRIKPDVLAPGWSVSTIDVATLDQYTNVNGTSFSTPIAAGVGALLLEAYPWLTPLEMADLLRSTASQADLPDNDHGYGIINAAAAGALYCNCVDLDDDTYLDEACGGSDCLDTDPAVNPGASEQCNGIDDDCDDVLGEGESDIDQDGYLGCVDDCDDDAAGVNPGATEVCDNRVDDDCDELVDAADPDCLEPGDTDETDSETGTTGDGDSTDGDGSTSESGGDSEDESGGSETDGDPAVDDSTGCTCELTDRTDGRGPDTTWAALLVVWGFVRRRRTTTL